MAKNGLVRREKCIRKNTAVWMMWRAFVRAQLWRVAVWVEIAFYPPRRDERWGVRIGRWEVTAWLAKNAFTYTRYHTRRQGCWRAHQGRSITRVRSAAFRTQLLLHADQQNPPFDSEHHFLNTNERGFGNELPKKSTLKRKYDFRLKV